MSIRRGLFVGFAILGLAVAIPAMALALSRDYAGKHVPQIQFTAQIKHGKIKRIHGFGWGKLPCGPGKFPNTNGFRHSIRVRHNRFKHHENLPIETGVNVSVRGRFNPQGSKAKGVIKAEGACNSGKQHWTAKALR